MDFKKFQQPDSILRPAPFWAINDKITPEETARQMADMIDAGLSGGFFHSRHGLITDYLGEEWFAAMKGALDVAKEKDGYLWLYDEDLWPSGNAGGQVAGMKDEYRATTLQAEFIPAGAIALEDGEDEPRAAYRIFGRNHTHAEKIEQISIEQARSDIDSERVIFRRCYQGKTPWWGGESYANLLHPEAMRIFVEMTHDVYKKHLGDEFGGPEKGKRIPGIFTDEPQISQGPNSLPWWDGIPEVYSKWHNRDFWKDLPYLFFDGPEARKIRLLVHRTFLRQFCEAYSKPIFDWCEENGLEHTGHYNAEDNFEGQIRCHCGGIMAHYRYQQAPGIDHLCRHNDPMLLTVKQVGSAARQLGRPRVLTEIFGVSRHTNTFEDFKWIGDYDLVLGANFFCPHLTLYSAKGRRKRDYPPNWNYQQTYWKELRPLNDYFTRVGYVLSEGKAKPDVLILHPIESGTADHRFGFHPPRGVGRTQYQYTVTGELKRAMPVDLPAEDLHKAHALDQLLRRTLNATLNAGYDADLGDEGYLEDLGSVEGDRLRVGEMTYPVVIVPPSDTWRPDTFALLDEFVNAGGRLILVGDPPKELDCENASDRWQEIATRPGVETVPCSTRQIQEALKRAVKSEFTITGTDGYGVPGLYVQHRSDGEMDSFFIVNSDRNRCHRYVFTAVGNQGPIALWDPLTGTRTAVKPVKSGNDLRYAFDLPPAGSALIVTGNGAAESVRGMEYPDTWTGEVIPLSDTWNFQRSEPNVLVMDRVSASIDGGRTWWAEDLEYRIRRQLAEQFGTTAALQWQPWVAIRKGVFDGKGGEVILRYRFHNTLDHPKNASLVIENIEKGAVTVNGQSVNTSNRDWLWDFGFGRVDITQYVKSGENVVDFRFDYDFLSEVETAYIVGDFGVRLKDPSWGEIIEEPAVLKDGSWLTQGYPFYSGIMTYKTTFDSPDNARRTFLRLNRASGILYKVRLNGNDAGSILWRPLELELTNLINVGKNELEISVISSRQNTWGPLHEREGDDFLWCGPGAFETDGIVREDFSLFDYGLIGGAELVRI